MIDIKNKKIFSLYDDEAPVNVDFISGNEEGEYFMITEDPYYGYEIHKLDDSDMITRFSDKDFWYGLNKVFGISKGETT